MKKQPNRIRYVRFEGDCYMSAEDVRDLLVDKIPDEMHPYLFIIKKHLKSKISHIILSCSNLVNGMTGEDKKHWNKLMNPN